MPRTEVTGSQIKDASVSLTADVTGTLPVANGGTGSTTIALNNVVLGNGTGAVQTVAPGTSGNVLTSDGTTWSSSSPAVTLSNQVTLSSKTLSAPTLTGTTVASSGAAVDVFNTADQSTNFEKGVLRWASNVLEFGTNFGGTGNPRSLRIGVAPSAGTSITRQMLINSSAPFYQFLTNTSAAGSAVFQVGSTAGTSYNAASGTQILMSVEPTFNQSGSAAYTCLLVNPTETATGSGTKLLADFQVGGVSKAKIDNTGVITAAAGTATGNVVTIDGTQALTGKTLTAPTLTGTTVNAQNGIIESYNTADQSTNYEKVVYRWNSNVAEIASLFGGTGSARAVTIGVSSGAGNATVGRSLTIQNAVPFVSCTSGGSGNSSTASGGAHIRLGSTSSQFTASSLHQTVVSVAGNMGQSGTASYTGLLVDITETSTGSGTKHLINAQVGGSSKFLVDNAGAITSNGVAVPTISSTHTLTSKRITPRVTTTNAPGATPTVATDSYDQINFTGLATAITSMTTNLTGTPTDGQMLTLRFKDDGTGRAITWGASYTSAAATLPTTTVANKTHLVRFLYDSAASKWACVSADATGY